jgi:hypothetical protein
MEKIKENTELKSYSQLQQIDEYIKQLENINLSPLPNTNSALKRQKAEVSGILKNIIYEYDAILSHKLKVGNSSGNLRNIDTESMHYWEFMSKYFRITSVKFINNIYNRVETNKEKGLAWLCISIIEKSFYETLREIYNQSFELKFYQFDALLIEKKQEILALTNKLNLIHYFDIDLDIIKEYNDYKHIRETDSKKDEELPFESSPEDSKKAGDKTLLITPFHLNLNSSKDFVYIGKDTGQANFTSFMSKGYENFSNLQSKSKIPLN